MSEIEQALLSEFASHYLGDTLPPPGELDAIVPALARGTAARLRRRIKPADLPELLVLLSELRTDPAHPLHGHIMNRTEIHWPDVPEMWSSFQRLVDLIGKELEKG